MKIKSFRDIFIKGMIFLNSASKDEIKHWLTTVLKVLRIAYEARSLVEDRFIW